jgi:hypothetical protein
MPFLALLALLACQNGPAIPDRDDREGLVAALRLVGDDPAAAMTRCRALGDTVRGECVVAVVEAAPKHPEASGWCDEIGGLDRDECHFQRAEGTRSFADCAKAGSFQDDCRLHLWSYRARKLVEPTLPETVAAARDAMREDGIDPADQRFWSATFRSWLQDTKPLDRGACRTIDDPTLADACLHTAIAVWHDLLNRERDFGSPPCDGKPLPDTLAHVDDPELDAILAERLASDLCGGRSPR